MLNKRPARGVRHGSILEFAMQMEGFKRTEIKTSGARIVTVAGGSGPPLLLMHGNPFTHLSWHKVAPRAGAVSSPSCARICAATAILEKPPGGEDHSGYSFRAMAQDQVEVMAALGFDKFIAAGHDRGARVLHRMCLDHPDEGRRARRFSTSSRSIICSTT